MAESDTGPSGGGDELEQRLIRDLRRMYYTEDAVAQALARVCKRVAESNTSIHQTSRASSLISWILPAHG